MTSSRNTHYCALSAEYNLTLAVTVLSNAGRALVIQGGPARCVKTP